MTKQYFSRIVGTQFRLSANAILPVLEVDTPLILDPEPENPYDPLAVKVCLNVSEVGHLHSSIPAGHEAPIVHLGYLPRSGTKTDTTGFGNAQALRIMQGGPNWNAFLAFSPQGDALVRLEVYEEAA